MIQAADLTLSSRRGNALDIASLLIALYRASGIPARYVHGTIDVPTDRFRNWAGTFETIPTVGDVIGGRKILAVSNTGNKGDGGIEQRGRRD